MAKTGFPGWRDFDPRNAPRATPAAGAKLAAQKTLHAPPRGMNKLELGYATHLGFHQAAGAIRWWAFEALKFRLADRTWYTPDFVIEFADGHMEVHETKGHWREDARIKIKVAAVQFPWLIFYGITKDKDGRYRNERFSNDR